MNCPFSFKFVCMIAVRPMEIFVWTSSATWCSQHDSTPKTQVSMDSSRNRYHVSGALAMNKNIEIIFTLYIYKYSLLLSDLPLEIFHKLFVQAPLGNMP